MRMGSTNKLPIAAGLLVALSLTFSPHIAMAQTIKVKGGPYRNWFYGTWLSGNGSASMARTTGVGDPPPAVYVTTNTTFGQGTAAGYGIDTAYTTSAPLQGRSYKLNLVFESGAGAAGLGQAVVIVVSQAGSVYGTELNHTGLSTGWKALHLTGVLASSAFTKFAGSGPATPDFTSGIATQFGFGGYNTSAADMTNYYDKFVLIIK